MHYYNEADLGRFGDIAKHKPELFEKFMAWYQACQEEGELSKREKALIGLAVAVPAVFGYNWLLRQNKLAFESVRSFGAQLHSLLLATTDLTPSNDQLAREAYAQEAQAMESEAEFSSEAGAFNSHLSSPDVTPDIKI